jgi:hypothetical protein
MLLKEYSYLLLPILLHAKALFHITTVLCYGKGTGAVASCL